MSKVFGNISDYAPVRQERSRTVASYGMEPEQDGIHATWHEVYFYRKRDGIPDLSRIKAAIIADINARVTERIISSLTWNGKPVWLSVENQLNWKDAYDRAVQTEGASLPVKFKLGEDGNGDAVYHTFTSVKVFGDFHDTWMAHRQQCLTDGWAMKDSIDWDVYRMEDGQSQEP